MDCKKAQRLIQERGAAAGPEAHRHATECSDCRVTQQRALHLQQLLAVKRHETPGAHYFDNFLGDFHRRLAVATAPRPTLWQKICTRLHLEPVAQLRYGYAHALGVVFAVALVWRGLVSLDLPANIESDVMAIKPTSTPRMLAAALPVHAPVAPVANTPIVIPAAATRADFTAPRYVLDRINVSPANYEVASIHF